MVSIEYLDYQEHLFTIDEKYGYKKTLTQLYHFKKAYSNQIETEILNVLNYSGDRLKIAKKYGYKESRSEGNKSYGALNYKGYWFSTILCFYRGAPILNSIYIDYSYHIPKKFVQFTDKCFNKCSYTSEFVPDREETFIKEFLKELDVLVEFIERLKNN